MNRIKFNSMTVQRDMKPKNPKAVGRATSCPDLVETDGQTGEEESSKETTPSSILARSRYLQWLCMQFLHANGQAGFFSLENQGRDVETTVSSKKIIAYPQNDGENLCIVTRFAVVLYHEIVYHWATLSFERICLLML